MNQTPRGNRGLPAQAGIIKMIVIIVIALIVLGYFGYNLREIINSPDVSENLSYSGGLLTKLWDNFLVAPATWIWDNIIIDIVWNGLQSLLQLSKNGGGGPQ